MKTAFTETKGWEILKSGIIAVVISLVCILLFALIIKAAGLSNDSIAVFDIVGKAVSLLLGCLFGFRDSERGWCKGLLAGVVFVLLSFVVFGILQGQFAAAPKFFYHLLFGAILGMLSGIITTLVKTR